MHVWARLPLLPCPSICVHMIACCVSKMRALVACHSRTYMMLLCSAFLKYAQAAESVQHSTPHFFRAPLVLLCIISIPSYLSIVQYVPYYVAMHCGTAVEPIRLLYILVKRYCICIRRGRILLPLCIPFFIFPRLQAAERSRYQYCVLQATTRS